MARRRDPRTEVLAHGPSLLASLLDQREAIDEQIRDAARDLVLAGMSYADLARLLGTTRQAARQRWAPAVDAWRASYGDALPWEMQGFEAPSPDDDWEAQMRVQLLADEVGRG